jgi:hypothetical protein
VIRLLSRLSLSIGVVSLLAARSSDAAAANLEPASYWKPAVQAGWWNAGLDVTSPQGVFLSVGVPWVLYLPILKYGGQQGVVALDTSVGYAYDLSAQTTLSGKLLAVWSYDWGNPCGDCGASSVSTHRFYFFPVLGLRHRFANVESYANESTSGMIVGLDLALAVFSLHHIDGERGPRWHLKNIPPWAGVAFSQVYIGYSW